MKFEEVHYGPHRPLREGLLRPRIGLVANPERNLTWVPEKRKRNRHLTGLPKALFPVRNLVGNFGRMVPHEKLAPRPITFEAIALPSVAWRLKIHVDGRDQPHFNSGCRHRVR